MARRTDQQTEAEICRVYEETSSCKKTAKIVGMTKVCVLSVLRRNGVKLKQGWKGRFDPDPDALAAMRMSYESGESVKAIAIRLGTSWMNVYGSLIASGATITHTIPGKRQTLVKEDAFDEITEDSAYWVGFLMADGYVLRNTKGESNGIGLTLAVKDEGHVVKFLEFLNSNRKITYGINENRSNRAKVSVSSTRIAKALERFGVIPNKTHTAEVYELEMNRDFWRGVIDGDGCIHVKKDGSAMLSVIGSKAIASQFRDFVRTHAPASNANIFHIKKCNVYTFSCHKLSAMRVIEVLYKDCKTALDRKKAIADALLSDPTNFKDGREHEVAKYNRYTLAMLEEMYKEMGSWKAVCDQLDVSVPNLANYRVKLRKAAVAAGDVRDEDFPTRMLRVKLKKSDEARFGPSNDTVQADPQGDYEIPPGYLF